MLRYLIYNFIIVILSVNLLSCTTLNDTLLNTFHFRPKITKITSKYNEITIKLSKDNPEKLYRLNYYNNNFSQWIKPEKNCVVFPVDFHKTDKNSCFKFQVKYNKNDFRWVTPSGEFYSSNFCYKSNISNSYKENLLKKDRYENELAEANENLNKTNNNISYSSNSVTNNRAYNDCECILPHPRSTPPRPRTICDNEDKYTKKQLLCLVPLGSEACSMIAQNFVEKQSNRKLYNFIAAPNCSKMLYKLAKEEYPKGSAILDSLVGAADDISNKAFEYGFFGAFIGIGIRAVTTDFKLKQVDSCFQQLKESCNQPIERWNKKVKEIENEPYSLKESCEYHVEKLASYIAEKNQIEYNINKLENKIDRIIINLVRLSKKSELKNY